MRMRLYVPYTRLLHPVVIAIFVTTESTLQRNEGVLLNEFMQPPFRLLDLTPEPGNHPVDASSLQDLGLSTSRT